MPTGYTSEIEKGITFQEYALRCARAFGALVTMRDDPMDASIPDEFKPSDYNLENIEKAEKSLATIKAMTPSAIKKAVQEEFNDRLRVIDECIDKNKKLKNKYENMLIKVKAWTPPTPDHVKLKEFMVEQLEKSIEFDCNIEYHQDDRRKLKLLDVEDWRLKKINQYLADISYHQKKHKAEVDRCTTRSKWVKDLRESLKEM